MTDNSGTPGTLWVLLTFAVALVLRIVPLKPTWALLNPDWVALTLIFWTLANPQRVGVLRAWLIGLIADEIIVGDAPVMTAQLIERTQQGSLVRTNLFETCVAPLINAPQAKKFIF